MATYFETNYLKIYYTDLHQIFSISRNMEEDN